LASHSACYGRARPGQSRTIIRSMLAERVDRL
jgi:hypothetical protein